MSIEEVKDIKKLQRWLKSALDELKYIKECCRNAGKELEKNSFAWDSKEKNLVIQAIELNEKFEASQARVKELEKDIKNLKEEYHIQKTKIQQRYEDLLGFDIFELEGLSQEDKNVLDNSTIKSLFNENKDLKYKLKTTEESLKGITQFDINNKCGNSEYFTYTDNNIKDDILINLHTKN